MRHMNLEYWPLERLHACERPLRSNDACVERMVAAIQHYGFRVPLLVRADGEVVDGHLRLKAARQMALDSVPVLLVDDLDDGQVRAFRLLVNRSATWATWNEAALSHELAELQALHVDLTLTGFEPRELDRFLGALALDAEDALDAAPEPPVQPVSRPGDVWLLGGHRLLCGDATLPEAYAALMQGTEADMVWTDPPYNVGYEGKAGTIKNDAMSDQAFAAFLQRVFRRIAAVVRKGGAVYVAHADAGQLGVAFRQAYLQAGLKLASCLIWRKNTGVLSRADYHWQHEPILYGWRPGAPHAWYGDRKQTTVQDAFPAAVREAGEEPCWHIMDGERIVRISGRDVRVEVLSGSVFCEAKPQRNADHPTMKPVALIERMLANSSKRGDVVLDPFGGSGSTLMACERQGRICRTMELDPRFVDVIIRRWEDATGREALLENGVQPFAEVGLVRGVPHAC
ncbi:DNA modification methylase [uncultured Desulfovibrio sp.]|uniref:DNA modification methylase n=1 Tax=uncultured Desulfovibrio sp. TaxID=167968 RepID=UPI00260FEB1E|nr:DNA modification methylase [uncultured Desulfovibrio sp.]